MVTNIRCHDETFKTHKDDNSKNEPGNGKNFDTHADDYNS